MTTNRAVKGIAVACLTWLVLLGISRFFPDRLIINRTASIPKGLYWNSPLEPVQLGRIAMFAIPEHVRDLLYQRRMIPRSEFYNSLSKPVVALGGDHVCVRDRALWINQRRFNDVPATDSLGRDLPRLSFCRQLVDGEVFVATSGHSFDSRYFGPIRTETIRGVIRPLWTW